METVFVTGATAGFGEAITRLLIREGHTVVASGRRVERLEDLSRTLQSPRLHTIALDVRDADAVKRTLQEAEKAAGPITALVNNAGLAVGLETAQRSKLEDWNTMVDTNIKGVLNCTQAVLPAMVERNRGYILNIGSVAGTYPYPGGNVYGATKAFVHQFSLNLRTDLLGTAVRVTCIEPGMAETEFSKVRFSGDEEKARAVYRGLRSLSAEDIAETVRWCLSLPVHVNINSIEIMPTAQAFSSYATHRDSPK